MDDLLRQALLFDFYAGILTERQQEICRMHLQEDWSLGEISEEMGISRQAVSDAIRTSQAAMEKTEARLHMVQRFMTIRDEIDQLEQLLDQGACKEQIKAQIQTMRNHIVPEVTE